MFKSTKLLIVLTVFAGIALCAIPALADTWDAVGSFSTTNATGATNGWSYGTVVDTATVPVGANGSTSVYTSSCTGYTFTAFTASLPNIHGGGGFSWLKDTTTGGDNGDLSPMIGVYTQTSTWWIFTRIPPMPLLNYGVNGDIYVDVNDVTNFPCILRWTAPASGNYSYAGHLQEGNNGHKNNFWLVKQSGSTYTTLYSTGPSAHFVTNTDVATVASSSPVAMSAGDHLDFVVGVVKGSRSWLRFNDLIVTSTVPPGVQGVVKNSAGTGIAGATVSDGLGDSIVTGSDGSYVLTILSAPGTFTVTASAAHYTSQPVSVVIAASGKVTQNFTLPNGNTISGKVTTTAGAVPLPAVSIISSDAVYTAATDSAGNYSMLVTPGTYSLQFSKLEYGRNLITVDASAGNAVQNVSLSVTYDLANDFSVPTNPGGNWEYGFISSTSFTTLTTPITSYNANQYYAFLRSENTGGENPPFGALTPTVGWWIDWATSSATIAKNTLVTPYMANDGNGANTLPIPGGEVVMTAGGPTVIGLVDTFRVGHLWDGQTAVARFTVPNSGLFTVNARFGAAATPHTAHVPVALRYSHDGGATYTYWLGDSTTPLGANPVYVDGFQGTAINGFADSYATSGTPVQTYSNTLQLTAGDTIEALVGFNANQVTTTDSDGNVVVNATNTGRLGRFVQTDLSIGVPAGVATIVGTVTTGNAAGNPAIPGVVVTATAGSNHYSGTTDDSGVYLIGVPAGSYTLTATKLAYSTGSGSATVAASGNQVVDFSLNGNYATTMAQLKSYAVGQGVILSTPLQLASGIINSHVGYANPTYGFDKAYGSYTNSTDSTGPIQVATPEYSFYLQSDDRVSGLKCVYDATLTGPAALPILDPTWKVACTGVMVLDSHGQKVFNVTSIDGDTQAATPAQPRPIGKNSKGLSNSGTLVKAWGKITAMQANTLVPPEQANTPPNGILRYTYEYITINDGGQDVKIPMHCQCNWMSSMDSAISQLKVGDYISVIGIAGTTTGSDVAVYPRHQSDIFDYTVAGP